MMGWAYGTLGLSADHQSQIGSIQDELRKRHWELMGTMLDHAAALRHVPVGVGAFCNPGEKV